MHEVVEVALLLLRERAEDPLAHVLGRALLGLPVELTRLDTKIDSLASVVNIVSAQLPTAWPAELCRLRVAPW